jgi:hypothetical protein
MTTPNERTRAVLMVYEVAADLSNHYRTRPIPQREWRQLMMAFRHYPTASELRLSHDVQPNLWGNVE